MMNLNTIFPTKKSKNTSKRLGRGIGSGLGKTGGRGHKGQKSRSGHKIRRNFEGGQMPITRRLPKFGFSSRKKKFSEEIRLCDLNKIKTKTITLQSLKDINLIKKNIHFAKIISFGTIKNPVTVDGLNVTKSARISIEFIGGKVNFFTKKKEKINVVNK